MAALLDRILKARPVLSEQRFSFNDWIETFAHNGNLYSVPQTFQTWKRGTEGPSHGFANLAVGALGSSGPVFACFAVRSQVFSQVRYQFREVRGGRDGDYFGTSDLAPLERPWVGGTTANLNARMLLFADLGGNAYVTPNSRGELRVLRPDWVSIIAAGEDPDGVDAEIEGYIYTPGGPGSGRDPELIRPGDMAHFAPYPDPLQTWRGASWLSSVVRHVSSHKAAATYKERFFDNGATPNAIVKVDPAMSFEHFKEFKEDFVTQYGGRDNAWKTWFLGGGADATVVGSNFDEMSFNDIQNADEKTICAAARVPLQMVGLGGANEGGAGLNQGNYDSAKREFADTTIAHLATEAAGSLETLVNVPHRQGAGSRLAPDVRDVPFFRQDAKDEADVRYKDSQTIRNLLDAGVTFDTIKKALADSDWAPLEHSGLFSVQLQKPGSSEVVSVPIEAASALMGIGWKRVDALASQSV